MKVLFLAFLIAVGNTFVYKGPKTNSRELANARAPKLVIPAARKTSLVMQNRKAPAPLPQDPEKRKLFLDDLQQHYSSFDVNQMDNTNTHTYEMQAHNRRSVQLRQMGSWFGDLDMTVDDYRDSIAQKLDQLNMSLQRPKIPVPGFGAALTLPFANMPAMNMAPQIKDNLQIDPKQSEVFGIDARDPNYKGPIIPTNNLVNNSSKDAANRSNPNPAPQNKELDQSQNSP